MSNPITRAIEERRTINLFDASRPIDDEQIHELIRLASTAPTAFNLQNWRFIAVRTPEAKARLRALAWDQTKVTEAAVTFIVCGQLPDYQRLPERLAPCVEAGFMPSAMVQGWEGAAKSLYFERPQGQRDEAVRTATFGAGTLIHAAHALGLGTSPICARLFAY
ncbi:MAG: nitroreductase family protein [Pseudomonadota bacterium]